jgi:hypothetical protein
LNYGSERYINGMSETAIQQRIRLALGKLPWVRMFRNNCGKLPDPRTGRWIEFGVGSPGGGDLLGWRTVTITPEMVGQRVAQFVSLEVKTPTGRVRPEQERWRQAVERAGGIAAVVRSVEDAERALGVTDYERDCA